MRNKVFLLWTTKHNEFKFFSSLLEKEDWEVRLVSNFQFLHDLKEEETYCLAILDPVNYLFSPPELDQLRKFCSKASNSLIVASSGNEFGHNTSNINDIVSVYGVKFNQDCVIRPNPYKQYHPKHVMLEDFIVNRGLAEALRKYLKADDEDLARESELVAGTRILYPNGCTLQVNKTSTIVMTSSKWAMPSEQAICSFYKNYEGFKMIALGSALMMSDAYIQLEENTSIIKVLLEFFSNVQFSINVSDAKTVEVSKPVVAPEIMKLVDRPIPCLKESEPLPEDVTSLVDRRLYTLDTSNLPAVLRAYKELNVEQEPLALVKPNLELKTLELEPATHGFLLRR